MTMPKRSMGELRKLRKKVEVYEKALSNITAGCATKSIPSVERAIEECDTRLAEIDEKEAFLRKLELPKHHIDADNILAKIRERSDSLAARKPDDE